MILLRELRMFVLVRIDSERIVMKKTLYFISAFLLLGVFTSCEKYELDDHCPEENQAPYVNPQELRVNDDSDNEEGKRPSQKSSIEDSENSNVDSTTSNDGGVEDPSDKPNGDDLINDDSDNEDEGGRPRNPKGSGKSPK